MYVSVMGWTMKGSLDDEYKLKMVNIICWDANFFEHYNHINFTYLGNQCNRYLPFFSKALDLIGWIGSMFSTLATFEK